MYTNAIKKNELKSQIQLIGISAEVLIFFWQILNQIYTLKKPLKTEKALEVKIKFSNAPLNACIIYPKITAPV